MRPRVLSLRTKSNFLPGVRTKPLSCCCIYIHPWIRSAPSSLAVVYTSMDSECPIANVQPTLDDGAAEACDRRPATARSRASESTETRERRLARNRARRRELLASETAEERETRLSQRRVRDRARRAASRPSTPSETRREQMRSTERQRRAVESQAQRETRLTRYRLSQQRRLEAESPEERETRLAQARLSQQRRLEAESLEEREARLARYQLSQQQRLEAETPEERAARLARYQLTQQQRLEAETPEERAARLQDLRAHQQPMQSSLHTPPMCISYIPHPSFNIYILNQLRHSRSPKMLCILLVNCERVNVRKVKLVCNQEQEVTPTVYLEVTSIQLSCTI